ncbi:MAG: phosphatidylcholine/phosphatidylserine synthase [Planctomycetes bacterium]|nr:phosphatidylcholine/phosphatidylserine synthase [Planctomycetota bacterium]
MAADPNEPKSNMDAARDAAWIDASDLPDNEESRRFLRLLFKRGRRKRRRLPGLAMLPSMMTLGNGICGVAAIFEFSRAHAYITTGALQLASDHLFFGGWLIFAAMILDGLDGKIARLTGVTGRFGAELDSLSDAISFGVAPGVFLWTFGQFFYGSGNFETKALWAVGLLYAACAILRLARFNAETDPDPDHQTFQGMPSPGAASAMLCLFLLLNWLAKFPWFGSSVMKTVLPVIVPLVGAAVGLLMVTRVRYVHFMNRLLNRQRSFRSLIYVLLSAVMLLVLAEQWMLVLPVGVFAYVLSGPVYLAYRFLRGRGVLGRRQLMAERQRQRRERAKVASRETAAPSLATGENQ